MMVELAALKVGPIPSTALGEAVPVLNLLQTVPDDMALT